MRRIIPTIALLVAILALAGCTPKPNKVTGTIAYRERMALPENAVINVQIQDTTVADAPAVVIGETTFESAGKQVPIPFEVEFDPAKIEDGRIYTIRATISVDGQLSFTTDTVTPVITGGNPTDELELMLVGAQADELVGTEWKWQRTQTPVEEIVPPNPANYTIEFMADGSYAGQADCNRIMGGYTIDDQRITIQPGATTLMACPEGSLDTVYIQQLTSSAIFFFQDGHLFIDLIYDSGTMEFAP